MTLKQIKRVHYGKNEQIPLLTLIGQVQDLYKLVTGQPHQCRHKQYRSMRRQDLYETKSTRLYSNQYSLERGGTMLCSNPYRNNQLQVYRFNKCG